ncbi:MAG: GtrA family protein [Rikenellaceae bacterium]|nr:GtrA family protein [Rikenellaceae bacterium]
MKGWITRCIDWFYLPIFRRWIPKELFRYGFCGAANLCFDILLYAGCYHFLFHRTNWQLGCVVISPHIAALLISSPIATLTGFWLQKNITFKASPLRSSTQLFRYVMVYLANLTINYLGIKLLVDVLQVYPTVSKALVTVITVGFSFLMQKYFTFWRPRQS